MRKPGPLPDCLRVAAFPVGFYVLKDREGLYLIDTGFAGAVTWLGSALRKAGWEGIPVRGILLTHGHIDHIFNAGRLARDTGAWLAGPGQDAQRYAGKTRVGGAGRPVAAAERLGFRVLPGFKPFKLDRELADGDGLEIWGGLRAVHLPGHTAGHSGYWSEQHGVLFCGDLFASFPGGMSHTPPAILNEEGARIPASVAKALGLGAHGMLPHHTDGAEPAEHLRRLEALALRQGIAAG